MTIYDRIETLRKSEKISQGKLEKELGFSNGSISKWKNSTPTLERLQKIAEYFNVTVDYLMTGNVQEDKPSGLTARDKRDISKDLDRIMDAIANDKDGPLFYNGQPLDDEDIIFLSKAIEVALNDAKKKNKVTYNPHKNKPKA